MSRNSNIMFKISPKAARINAEKSILEVARHLGVTTRTISNYEKGSTLPDADRAEKMALYYNIPLDYIFFKRKSA